LAANVRELALYHHDPSHSDIQIDAMVAMGRQRAAGSPLMVSAAAEGNTITFATSAEAEQVSCGMHEPTRVSVV